MKTILCPVLCAAVLAAGCGHEIRTTEVALAPDVTVQMVRVPGGIWFGRTEVTQAQWEAVMGGNPSHFKGADLPVENVSWNDCQEFLKRLREIPSVKASGLSFRLPTEEEWERACLAGGSGSYCELADGTEITEKTLDRVAWYDHGFQETTQPVGTKEPNAYGLFDMLGNVEEWTQTAGDECRVRRGGSWSNPAWYCKATLRNWLDTDSRFPSLGLRLCAE